MNMKKLFFCTATLIFLFQCKNTIGQVGKDTSFEFLNRIVSDTEALKKINEMLADKKYSVERHANLQVKLVGRHNGMGKYEEALKLANQFILEQEPKLLTYIPRLYNMKAGAYYYMFNVDKGMECIEKGIGYAEKLKDYPTLITMSSNLGAMYSDRASVKGNKTDYLKAEEILRKAIIINEEQTKDLNLQYYLTKRLLAITVQALGKRKEAEQLYLEAIEGLTRIKEFGEAYMGALTFYARFLSEEKRSTEAFAYLEKAIEVQRKSNNKKDLTALYYVAHGLYKDANDKDKALLYLDSTYRNQLIEFEDVQNNAIAASEAKFGNEILKKDILIANQKKQKYIFLAGLIASIGLLIGIAVYYRQKRKDEKQKIALQKQTMDAYLQGEEKEKVRLSRELHDGIAQDLLALRFTFQKYGMAEQELNEIDKIGSEVRNLSHQLMPLTLKMMGLIPAIEEMCNKLFPPSNIEHEIMSNGIDDRLPLTLETSLYRITQELVQNIIKHSNANYVMIQIANKNNFINLIVQDNGSGFDANKKADGIGLHNLKSRVQMINGKLSFESNESDGTIAIIRVPLEKNA
jgi:signal transduction histidine kinase